MSRLSHGARRVRAVSTIRRSARRVGSTVDLQIARTARVGRLVVHVTPGTHTVVRVGDHTTVHDGVELRLGGGSLTVADWVDLRGGARLLVSGHLDIRGENVVSWGTVIHCAESVTIQRQASVGEYVTITDSVHEHAPGVWHVDVIRTSPVMIGSDTWIGAKATVTRGITIGSHSIVGANAVVTTDVPDRSVALGIPARVRPLPPGQALHEESERPNRVSTSEIDGS